MKRGGSKPAYADQFNLLSPCYKDGEQPAGFHYGGVKAKSKPKKGKTTKSAKGKAPKKKTCRSQKGGSTCYASPSVSEMGIYDKPASLEPTASELAWNKRMTGGEFGNGNNGKPKGNNGKPKGNSTTITSNLFSINSPRNVGSQAVGNSLSNGNSKKNSPLNKIKNNLLPEETISGLAMIVKKISKNSKNSKSDKYSIEFVFKTENGNTKIKELEKTEFVFSDISTQLREILKDVFPPLKTANAVKQVNTRRNNLANATGLTSTNSNANATGLTSTNSGAALFS